MPVVSEQVPPAPWAGVFYFKLQTKSPRQYCLRGRPPAWLAYDHCHCKMGTVPFGWDSAVKSRMFGGADCAAEMVIRELDGKTYAVPVKLLDEFEQAIKAKVWE